MSVCSSLLVCLAFRNNKNQTYGQVAITKPTMKIKSLISVRRSLPYGLSYESQSCGGEHMKIFTYSRRSN